MNRSLIASLVVASGLVAIWTWWPLGQANVTAPSALAVAPPVRTSDEVRAAPLDLVAFGAPVWDPAPLPPAPVAAVVPVPVVIPPLRVQLLGIARDLTATPSEPDRFVAAIYDEVRDKVFMLRSGDTLGAAKVVAVTGEGVEIADAAGTRQLALRSAARTTGMPLLDLLAKQPTASPASSTPPSTPMPPTPPAAAPPKLAPTPEHQR